MLKNKKVYVFTITFFIIIILIGAVLLELPICNKEPINYIDALFEATSSVSTTGTTVFNLLEHFTFWGQLVIICLVQIGAIGFMAFFYFLFMFSKKKIKLSNTMIMENETNLSNYQVLRITIKKIIQYTFVIEFIGMWLLSFRFVPIYGFSKGIWYSLFHSVSAYCNAGFDLFGNNSFLPIKDDIYFNSVIILLMFLGSLGFFVIEELTRMVFRRSKKKN